METLRLSGICLLVWMGQSVDIEGRGLGELCTYDNMFSKKLRSNPGKSAESRPPPEHEVLKEDQAGSNPGLSHVALAGPDPEPMHDDFVAIVYPQVHEILKHTIEEHVHLENPLSSSGTLSSMKNLDETFRDQFFNDKPTKEPGKTMWKLKLLSLK
ncbi:hypothetical protein Tco_0801995 [Tanacetum coccineum]|uniref:Uncharacterized protein n=1 Tax=Tanacetum coccineum TaxID=301880 RepID=A0ABQ4ZYD4_9ASTR